jgi:hypothetical protein
VDFELGGVVADLVERLDLLWSQPKQARDRVADRMRKQLPVGEGAVGASLDGRQVLTGFRTPDRRGGHLPVGHLQPIALACRFEDGM